MTRYIRPRLVDEHDLRGSRNSRPPDRLDGRLARWGPWVAFAALALALVLTWSAR